MPRAEDEDYTEDVMKEKQKMAAAVAYYGG